jgi:hypothetical protein
MLYTIANFEVLRRHVVVLAGHLRGSCSTNDARLTRGDNDPKAFLWAIDDRENKISGKVVQGADTTRLQNGHSYSLSMLEIRAIV